MSIALMTKVWNQSKHSGTPLLLMLAIADCANEEGEAWPGRAMLAQRIRKSKSYTTELLQRLIKSHELKRTHSGGKGQGDTDHYRITIKGRPADPTRVGPPTQQGSARRPNKGRLRVGLGSVVTLKNRTDPLDPLTNKNIYTSTTTINPVVVMKDEWDLVQLLKLGRATKTRMAEVAEIDPAPVATAYVAHYLYGMTIHKINSPAHFAAKRIVEQLEAGEPFETLAGQGPKWLTECLHWIFTGGVEDFDGLIPQALALKNYLPTEIAGRLIPRAFDELGLADYLPPPQEHGPVEYVRPEKPVLDEWQQALEILRPHYATPTMQALEQCAFIGRENGTMLIAAPTRQMLQWFEIQKMSTSLADYGVSVAFRLREHDATAS